MRKWIIIALLLGVAYGSHRAWRASKGTAVVVLSQLKEYSSSDEPQSTGAKFYHIKDNRAYTTVRIVQIESGITKELAEYTLEAALRSDDYLTLSFFPELDGKSWWAWCARPAANQHVILQGPIDGDWRLANASRDRTIDLQDDRHLIDTIIFCRKGQHIESVDYHRIWACKSLQDLVAVTLKISGCRVVALTIDKTQQDGGGQPATRPESK